MTPPLAQVPKTLWDGCSHVRLGPCLQGPIIPLRDARQGYDLQLTRYDEKGWRATFYTTGMEHSPTSATGTAWGAHAVGARRSGPHGRP